MSIQAITTADLDYLTGLSIKPSGSLRGVPSTHADPNTRRIWRVRGIGRTHKSQLSNAAAADRNVDDFPQMTTALVGIHRHAIPLVFCITGSSSGLTVDIGTWSSTNAMVSEHVLKNRTSVIYSALSSVYPQVDATEAQPAELVFAKKAGILLGIPSRSSPDATDPTTQMDRLVRSLAGTRWAFLLLAQPLSNDILLRIRNMVLAEFRRIESESKPGLVSKAYNDNLKQRFVRLQLALGYGAWRTAVYLIGDESSYTQLTGVAHSIFTGTDSFSEPLRIFEGDDVLQIAMNWQLPDLPASEGPTTYRHPYLLQSLLGSEQLSTYVSFPENETLGFQITAVPSFDVAPSLPTDRSTCISVGNILDKSKITEASYYVPLKSLTKHTFVAGVTGSGKTNTIFHILKQASLFGIPFMVIEPAKTEYRALMSELGSECGFSVYTLGNERVSPFRLNPFEVLPGIPVGVHIDLLRSVFTASFGMWTPLPQILEQALYQIYEDFGWDIANNTNSRLDKSADVNSAFPTLSDLHVKVNEVINQLGYEAKIADDMRAALHTRLNSLRSGGKGKMLDVRRSLPMTYLAKRPVVMELQDMGDDDDKAFMMGLLLIRLVEFCRASGEQPTLRHLLVIEEAHRLLTNTGPRSREEEANPKAKAVETFSSLLSEIRAYGQGVIISDQIPNRLAVDIIKNTNLKLAHRIVAEDDRTTLAGATHMDDQQTQALAILTLGQAAVFAEGEDAPLLTHIPRAKGDVCPTDDEVATFMKGRESSSKVADVFVRHSVCREVCNKPGLWCGQVRNVVEDVTFQRSFARVTQTILENGEAIGRMWTDVISVTRPHITIESSEKDFIRCTIVNSCDWLANKLGVSSSWSYSDTSRFADTLRRVYLGRLIDADLSEQLSQLHALVPTLFLRRSSPFPLCDQICQAVPKLCMYRRLAEELTNDKHLFAAWQSADEQDGMGEGNRRQMTWSVAKDAGEILVEWPEKEWSQADRQLASAMVVRAARCFAQQMLMQDIRRLPKTSARIMFKIMEENNHE